MGSDSAFDGLDGEHLVSAVVGTHRDAIRDVVINAKFARALRDGLEQGFDPATGQPATPERETAMRTELASTHDAITGALHGSPEAWGECTAMDVVTGRPADAAGVPGALKAKSPVQKLPDDDGHEA